MIDGESWKYTSVFSMTLTCRGRSCSLLINSGSTLNGVSWALVS